MSVDYLLDEVVLSRRLVDIFRPELTSLSGEIVDEIRATIPAYARPLDGPYGKSIRAGVHHALTLFVEHIADPGTSAQHCLRGDHRTGHRLGRRVQPRVDRSPMPRVVAARIVRCRFSRLKGAFGVASGDRSLALATLDP